MEKVIEKYLAEGYHFCGFETPNGPCQNLVHEASGYNGCLWHYTN